MASLTVVRPGIFTTVQDCGRWGFQARGVPVSGAMDWYSHRFANKLVDNPDEAATLEVTLVGPQIQFDAATVVAVSGAEFRLTLNDEAVHMNEAIAALPGAMLKFGERVTGARAYIAVAGGVGVREVLRSRSTHVLSGMGGVEGRALRAGDRVPISEKGSHEKKGPYPFFRVTKEKGVRPLFLPQGGARLRVLAADDELLRHLTVQRFHISPRSDRMGYRLEGTPIADAPTGELISTAVPTGAVQIPPTGQPILLMADHATTGGYAIAATVITADLPLAGQLAPGDWIEFEPCSLNDADAALREREKALAPGA
jgi:antagonist of KipI